MRVPTPPFTAADNVVRQLGAAGVPDLGRLLVSSDEKERLSAARWLAEPHVGGKQAEVAVRALALAVKDGSDVVAAAAIQGIGAIGSERDVWMLCAPLCEHKNAKIAAAAVAAFERFPSDRVAQLLEQKLLAGPHLVRMAVLATIAAACDEAFVSTLVRALGHPALAIRNRAAEVAAVLANSGKVDMGRTLVWLLRSSDVNVRRTAAQVLKNVPDPDGELWPKLVSALRDDDWWVRERIMDALVDLAGRGLSSYMIQWLADPSDVVRRFALSVLQRLRDPETIGALVHTAQVDTDWWVREKAIEVIAEFRDPRAVPVLAEILVRNSDLAVACIGAMQTIDPVMAAPFVIGLLDSHDADVRMAVLRLIEATNDTSHAAAIAPLRQDENAAVARAAHAIVARFRAVRSSEDGPITNSGAPEGAPLDIVLGQAVHLGVDDIILASGRPVFGKSAAGVVPLTERVVTEERVVAMLTPLLSSGHAARLESRRDVDLSYVIGNDGHRFRVVIFQQRGGISAVFRHIKQRAPQLMEIGFPKAAHTLFEQKNGLVIVAGGARMGKTTTLNAVVEHLNKTRALHIVAIEDPIEGIHKQQRSLVNQREVGAHTKSLSVALRSALRQDPDVIVLGEMRDAESIQLALTAAETGHLVVATLQTPSAEQAVEKLLAAFSRDKQDHGRASLSDVLRGVICQSLVTNVNGSRQHLACELLLNNDAVANIIRKGKTMQLASIIATSTDVGMQSFEQDIARLLRAGLIDAEAVQAANASRQHRS